MFDRLIAPSFLAADFRRLGEEACRAESAGADWFHLDVMDGDFVPNISFGPAVIAAIRQLTKLPLDVQLMVRNPQNFVGPLKQAGATGITVHIESEHAGGIEQTLTLIRELGCNVGLALNPETPLAAVEPYFEMIDLLLIMTVHPGFGGQPFLSQTVEKIEAAYVRRAVRGLPFRLEVDGGINLNTANTVVQAGADVLVSGTALFSSFDMAGAIRELRALPERQGSFTPGTGAQG